MPSATGGTRTRVARLVRPAPERDHLVRAAHPTLNEASVEDLEKAIQETETDWQTKAYTEPSRSEMPSARTSPRVWTYWSLSGDRGLAAARGRTRRA